MKPSSNNVYVSGNPLILRLKTLNAFSSRGLYSMASTPNDNPFEGMKINHWRVLDDVEGRENCPKCSKSRKYFCYTCYIPVPHLLAHVPRVELPVKIDIIKHASEIDGKSTAAHAAVIAPDDVTVYTYPCIPDYSSEENVVLIFPGKNALSIQEYVEQFSKKESAEDKGESCEPLAKRPNIAQKLPISRAVFIDSTWNQSRGIYKDQRLRAIPCVVFQSRISQFWRHQHGSPRWFLATIEAIHQFLVELHIVCKLGGQSNSDDSEYTKYSDSSQVEKVSNLRNETCSSSIEKPQDNEEISDAVPSVVNVSEDSSQRCPLPDKLPSKFVKNLALCRGIRLDPGGDPGIKLCGPDQWKGKYDGEYDNLLFFFQFMYHKIHSIYDHDKLRSYQRDMV